MFWDLPEFTPKKAKKKAKAKAKPKAKPKPKPKAKAKPKAPSKVALPRKRTTVVVPKAAFAKLRKTGGWPGRKPKKLTYKRKTYTPFVVLKHEILATDSAGKVYQFVEKGSALDS